jgi:hypothetical protein
VVPEVAQLKVLVVDKLKEKLGLLGLPKTGNKFEILSRLNRNKLDELLSNSASL